MLTVLVRYKKSGREVLFSADTVEYMPKGSDQEHADYDGLLIVQDHETRRSTHLSRDPENHADNVRDAFVMNRDGATVARYAL